MKSYTRGLAWTLVALGMLGVAGCGPDNETEGQKAAKAEKDPGPINPDFEGHNAAPGPDSGTAVQATATE